MSVKAVGQASAHRTDSGSAKDISTGMLNVTFTIGTALTDDSFTFDLTSTTSAETAMVDFGAGLEAADAFFEATIRLQSYSPAHIPGAVLKLPDMPALTDPSTESMIATCNTFPATRTSLRMLAARNWVRISVS